MKNRIISFILALTLVASTIFGATVFAGAEGSDAEYKGTSLNLAENITVKVKVATAKTVKSARITVDGAEAVTVPAEKIAKSGDDYLLEAEVAVKDFAKNVKFELIGEDGAAFFEKVTSAKAYCDVYKEGEFSGLLAALEVYAAAAAAYFDGAAAVSVNADLSGVADASASGEMPAGISHRSATLVLESETTVRHYFTLAEGKHIGNYKFFLDIDGDGKYDTNEKLSVASKLDKEGTTVYYVDVDGITPNELDEVYTVGVYGAEDGKAYTFTYGALTYAKSMANAGGRLASLVKALYNYNAEAGKLKGTVTFDADGGAEVASQSYEYGVVFPVVAPTQKAGATFLGWYDASGNKVIEIPASATGTVALKAKWTTEKYIIDASEVGGGAAFHCNNHVAQSEENKICAACGYCVDNPNCVIVPANRNAAASCATCGKAQRGAGTNYLDSTLKDKLAATSKSDKASGYATPITIGDGKEVLLFGVDGNAFYSNHAGTVAGNLKTNVANNPVFAITIEVGFPEESQYKAVETNPSQDFADKKAGFFFRISGAGGTDTVFNVSSGKAYVAGDSTKAYTLPVGSVEKLIIVFDFTGAVAGDGQTDSYRISLYTEAGDLVNSAVCQLKQKIYKDWSTGKETTSSSTKAVDPATGTEVTKNNEVIRTGDIGDYTSLLYQLRINNGAGRFLLGDTTFVNGNPFASNVAVRADDNSIIAEYTPGEATPLPEAATKDGYVFLGWYADAAFTRPIFEIPANAVGSFVVHAKWIKLGVNAAPTADGKLYFEDNSFRACYDMDGDSECDACGACLHIGFALNSDCGICENKVVAHCSRAAHTDEDSDGWCDVCHFLVAKNATNHPNPENANAVAGVKLGTGESNGANIYVVDGAADDYYLVHSNSGGPSFNAENAASIEALLNESDDMKVTFSIELSKIAGSPVSGASFRTRAYTKIDGADKPDTFNFASLASDGKFTFSGGAIEASPATTEREINLIYGETVIYLTEQMKRIDIVLDFEAHTMTYYVDGVVTAIYSNTVIRAEFDAETGKYVTPLCLRGTDGNALNARLNNYGFIRIGNVFTAAGDITDCR